MTERGGTALHDLYHDHGQSPWLDAIARTWLRDGELAGWIDRGVRGVTSNPTIFQSAISGSDAYDEQLAAASRAGLGAADAYWELACSDISDALALLRPLHDDADGRDGYASLEVDPTLAHDAAATVAAAHALHRRIDAPNLHVKVPATLAGVDAIRELIGAGRSINVTLIFSVERYELVADAYLAGLEAADGDISSIDSVASFFVSRVDAEVDRRLDEIGSADALALRGAAAEANAALALESAARIFGSDRFAELARRGARAQRLLWASTAPKNPDLAPTHYVDRLVAPGTVNTMPPATLAAVEQRGSVADTSRVDADAARRVFDRLAGVGVDIDDVFATLERQGLSAFEQSFRSLLDEIDTRLTESIATR